MKWAIIQEHYSKSSFCKLSYVQNFTLILSLTPLITSTSSLLEYITNNCTQLDINIPSNNSKYIGKWTSFALNEYINSGLVSYTYISYL